MSLRGRIFIIISLGILVILIITVALIWRGNRSPSLSGAPGTAPEQTSGPLPVPSGEESPIPGLAPAATPEAVPLPPPQDPVAIEKAGVTQLAKVFMERYNSYSTDNNWQNIKEVEVMVTPALWKRLSSRIGATQSGPFLSVATNVITAKLASWSPPSASVDLSLRLATEKSGATETSYQSVSVSLLKNGNNWYIDSFTWQK